MIKIFVINSLSPNESMKLKLTVLTILLAFSSCKEAQRELSNPEKVVAELQKEFGPFDEVDYNNDSTSAMYSYRPEGNKTKKVKGVIDKAMNMVGNEYISKYKLDHEYKFGSYTWETPTEKVSMRGALVYKDSSSYVNIWIDRK